MRGLTDPDAVALTFDGSMCVTIHECLADALASIALLAPDDGGPGDAPACRDDGLFCNGSESYDSTMGECVSSGSPCAYGQTCDEDVDACVELAPEPGGGVVVVLPDNANLDQSRLRRRATIT